MPYVVPLRGHQKLKLATHVVYGANWIQVKMLLLSHVEIPDDLKAALHEALLKANFDLNVVTYSVSDIGDVYVEADFPADTTYDNFESGYGSVEYGAKHFFLHLLPKLYKDFEPKSTYDITLKFLYGIE